MTCTAIVLAGGSGTRMGAGMPKALMPLAGRPMVAWTIAALNAAPEIDDLILVAPRGGERQATAALGRAGRIRATVAGGASRARSLRQGLLAVPAGVERILVHDAARPLVRPEHVSAVLRALEDADGAIIAAPSADTIKRADGDLMITATIDRRDHWLAQTPQAFRADALRRAVSAAVIGDYMDAITDCASLIEATGGRVRIVPCARPNLKVTTPADIEIAERLLEAG